MNITQKLAEFEGRRQAIERNADLSPEGRRKGIQAIDAEAQAYRGEALRGLQTAWGAWKVRARRNIEAIREASERGKKQFDYNRLQYAARTVGNTIAQAGNFADIAAAYNGAKERGDLHEVRAWIETSGAAILRRFGRDPEAIAFTKQLPNEAGALDSDEIRELKAEGATINREGQELDEQTQRARSYYHSNSGGIFGEKTAFDTVMEGVKISRRVEVETLATVTDISLVD